VFRADIQTDYQWLPPTPANRAKLTVRVPAGFKWDTRMPLSNACGFIPCH